MPGAVSDLFSAGCCHGGGWDWALDVLRAALAAAILRIFSFIDSDDGLHELLCRRIYYDGDPAIYGNLPS